ncbi:hypothetical protein PM082_012657 [Marasmius tenuissimus]|nr:hypothetical protein PM082_012657 [Marasmius tenuissimus]
MSEIDDEVAGDEGETEISPGEPGGMAALTAGAALDTANLAALSDDHEKAVTELEEQARSGESSDANSELDKSATQTTSATPTMPFPDATASRPSTLKSELIVEGKISVQSMVDYRKRLQSGPTTKSERVISISSRFTHLNDLNEEASSSATDADLDDPTNQTKISIKEASHRTRVRQELNTVLMREEQHKTRELQWKNVSQGIINSLTSTALNNLQSKNVSQYNPLRPLKSFVIMRTEKRTYIGKVLDMYKRGSGRHGSVKIAESVQGLSYLSLQLQTDRDFAVLWHLKDTKGIEELKAWVEAQKDKLVPKGPNVAIVEQDIAQDVGDIVWARDLDAEDVAPLHDWLQLYVAEHDEFARSWEDVVADFEELKKTIIGKPGESTIQGTKFESYGRAEGIRDTRCYPTGLNVQKTPNITGPSKGLKVTDDRQINEKSADGDYLRTVQLINRIITPLTVCAYRTGNPELYKILDEMAELVNTPHLACKENCLFTGGQLNFTLAQLYESTDANAQTRSTEDPILTKELVSLLLSSTNKYWNDWIRQSTYTGSWKEAVHRRALALKPLIYEPTGAVVASPTFSLPEYIGGTRNCATSPGVVHYDLFISSVSKKEEKAIPCSMLAMVVGFVNLFISSTRSFLVHFCVGEWAEVIYVPKKFDSGAARVEYSKNIETLDTIAKHLLKYHRLMSSLYKLATPF